MATAKPASATFADLARLRDAAGLEIIDGTIVERARPSGEHSVSSAKIGAVMGPFNRCSGARGPGGWWIHVVVHVEHAANTVCCHDAAGWRRERVPERPSGWPVRIRPDWVCEIASPNHEKNDFVDKLRILHGAQVPHYWILHPEERMLIVHRWRPEGYVTIPSATSGQRVRAEPFDAIDVGELVGDEAE